MDEINALVGLNVSLKSVHGTYLRADSNKNVVDQQTFVGPNEKWLLSQEGQDGDSKIPRDAKVFALKSYQGSYLRADPKKDIIDQQTFIGPNEKWNIIPQGNHYALQNQVYATYLRADSNKDIVDQQTFIGPYEQWDIDLASDITELTNLTFETVDVVMSERLPEMLASLVVSNKTDVHQTSSVQLSGSVSTSNSFTQTYGVKIGVSTSFKTGVPYIAEGKVKVSTEFSATFAIGKTETSTKTVTLTANPAVPAQSSVRASLVYTKADISVPWTATAHFAGTTVTKQVKGLWGGVTTYDLRVNIDKI